MLCEEPGWKNSHLWPNGVEVVAVLEGGLVIAEPDGDDPLIAHFRAVKPGVFFFMLLVEVSE